MDIWIFFFILVVHYIGDFLLQTYEEATGKSSSWQYLLVHVGKYTFAWFVGIVVFYVIDRYTAVMRDDLHGEVVLYFLLITFISHTITDYITSRESKKLFETDQIQPGMRVVGFDQILHYVQLIITFKYLFL